MSASLAPGFLSRAAIIKVAIPVILANAAVPLLGLVDTAVIGHSGSAADLGAIALGSVVFSFLYWGFGFLRMGTSGFTAQAAGAGDYVEVRSAFARSLLMGAAIGAVLMLLQYPLCYAALALLQGSDAVQQGVRDYFVIRIWGAPATLATYAILGVLIGLGKTRLLLWLQLWLNGVNLTLDIVFVTFLGWGVEGIALGTIIAEWSSFLLGLWMVWRLFQPQREAQQPLWHWARISDREAMVRTLKVNADILWRTLFLLAGFAWFVNQGALFGDTVLAANHILLQFISFSAFFLDGFAFVVESLAGRAFGARNRALFDHLVKRSTEVAAACAVLLALLVWFAGPMLIASLTAIEVVNEQAVIYLPYAAAYVIVSFAAFQLDGVFIGATRSREMRNASLMSLLVFLVLAWLLTPLLGNHGLWLAFIVYVIARAIALGFYLPRIRAAIA